MVYAGSTWKKKYKKNTNKTKRVKVNAMRNSEVVQENWLARHHVLREEEENEDEEDDEDKDKDGKEK